ncbi:hypothetical protein C6497_08210 [Candidatus Poribacteria bacterium]|nr:MAG: hypothetical protein C6497_08210 [Candidatus Poribacteria bacterium]
MMIIYKNDPKCKKIFMSKNRHYLPVGIVKIRKNINRTKSHFLQILIKLIQSGVKSVYDRG